MISEKRNIYFHPLRIAATTHFKYAIMPVMEKASIIGALRPHEAELRARGVKHAALFGSRAQGDHRADSDIDIVIEIDADAVGGVWQYSGLKSFIGELFDTPVDVVNRASLKPQLRPGPTKSMLSEAAMGFLI